MSTFFFCLHFLIYTPPIAPPRHTYTHTHKHTHTHIFYSKKKKEKQMKKRRSFKAEIIKRLPPRLKCYCFSHSRAPEFKFFLVGQPWWPTILFSVPWPLHFEIHFAGPVFTLTYLLFICTYLIYYLYTIT